MFQLLISKKKAFRLIKRNYMSSKKIQQFKHEKTINYGKENDETGRSYGEYEKKNTLRKIRRCDNSELLTPFEIFRWFEICNSTNVKLLSDLIKEENRKSRKGLKNEKEKENGEEKDTKFSVFDFYKIMNRYHVVINVNEHDMFVEHSVNEWLYNIVNKAEYNFYRCKLNGDFIKLLKENQSFLYYWIYEKGKFLQVLPFKFFWNYENTEDEYTARCSDRYPFSSTSKEDGEEGEGEEEMDESNEYVFKNVDLNRVDFFLKENDLNDFSKNNISNSAVEGNKGPNFKNNYNLHFQKRDFSSFYQNEIVHDKPYDHILITSKGSKVCDEEGKNDGGERKIEIINKEKEFERKQEDVHEKIQKKEEKEEEEETKNKRFVDKTGVQEENDFLYNIKMLEMRETREKRKSLRVNKLPVSPFSRATALGKIVFDVAKNSSFDYIKNMLIKNNNNNTSNNSEGNSILTEKNAEIIAKGLSKMRGVILKLGQMISLQDEHISPILGKALKIVHNSADAMPESQLKKVLRQELGDDFEKKFDSFNYEPFASASIGQVHEGIINNRKVAIKIQYPGVIESIDSDIKNVLFINQYTNLILKNLYIENICKEIKKELKCECDYINEAKYYIYFKNIFKNSKYFYVPSVYNEYVTKRVLVTSYVDGVSIEEVAQSFPQNVRDSIGQRILYLCLHELFVFKIMNTDPNLGNFIYDYENDKLCLIDFGATRSYKDEFVDEYLRLVKASTEENEKKVYHYSYMLNFFNGKENEEMKTSHIRSVILVGKPFKTKVYDFGQGDLAKEVYNLLPKIIHNRLVPPRSEIYTLHRKLSGSYLICMKLKAKVQAADIFHSIYNNYVFSTEDTFNEKEINKI